MISSSDHLSLKTLAAPVVNLCKAGGTFAAAGGTVTEIANGWYKVALNTTDTGTAGDLAFYITGTGADDTDFVDQVVDPTVANLGVNIVTIAGAAAALDGNNLLKVDTEDWKGGVIPAVNVTGIPLVDLKYILGGLSPAVAGSVAIDWNQISNKTSTVALTNTTIATVTTVTNQLTAAQIAAGVWQDTTAGDFTTASSIGKSLYTGVAPGAASGLALVGSNMGTVTSVTGSVGSVTGSVGSVTGAVGSVTGNVGGNVIGSVGSVAGNVSGNVVGSVGSVAGNVSGNVTGSVGSVVGNVGGNVTGSVGSVLAGGLTDLTVTTYAESSVVPAATATLKDKILWLATLAKNKITQTSSTSTLRNDTDTGTISTSTVGDDGTTFTRSKWS